MTTNTERTLISILYDEEILRLQKRAMLILDESQERYDLLVLLSTEEERREAMAQAVIPPLQTILGHEQ